MERSRAPPGHHQRYAPRAARCTISPTTILTYAPSGPDVHPGANMVEDEHGNIVHLRAGPRALESRKAISKTLLTEESSSLNRLGLNKKVYRHLVGLSTRSCSTCQLSSSLSLLLILIDQRNSLLVTLE